MKKNAIRKTAYLLVMILCLLLSGLSGCGRNRTAESGQGDIKQAEEAEMTAETESSEPESGLKPESRTKISKDASESAPGTAFVSGDPVSASSTNETSEPEPESTPAPTAAPTAAPDQETSPQRSGTSTAAPATAPSTEPAPTAAPAPAKTPSSVPTPKETPAPTTMPKATPAPAETPKATPAPTAAPTPAPTETPKRWVEPVYETVYHEETGHYETVVKQEQKQKVKCKCGEIFDTPQEHQAHQDAFVESERIRLNDPTFVCNGTHTARYVMVSVPVEEQVYVVDQEAWTETVLVAEGHWE